MSTDDEGEYTCLASNQLGSIEAKAYLVVFDKPVFTKTMRNLTVGIESKSLTIECNARGKPAPIIYWAKSGQLPSNAQTAGQDDFIILENGNLFIERLSKKYEGTYLCQASNEYGSVETKTNLLVKSVASKPPPVIVYGPQNQTIPINTQAVLECLTTTVSSILFDDISGQKREQLQSQYLSNEKVTISWLKDGQQINTQFDSIKYKIRDTGSLEVNSVQATDSGVYSCMATNFYGRTVSMPASLNVENPNNQYVEFQRNFDTTALPSAPSKPLILLATATSISLSWQPSSHSGHSPIVLYTIEYFSPEWPETHPGWVVVAENLPGVSSFTVNNLQPDTYYMFLVRAKNMQGYGPPSQVSELTKTLFEARSVYQNKNTNEVLERALTGEVVQLHEPAHVLSSSSISITWEILKSASLVEGFYVKYKPIGSRAPYHTLTINDKYKSAAVLSNLEKFTSYEILVEPFSGPITGSESNILQAKTLEDIPSHSPTALTVELDSVTSMAIKWQPPPADQLNGVIIGYKISCLANETKFSLNLNTNATTRAIIVGNLIKDMKYCVKVAAFTKKGTGPFTTQQCVEMSESVLANLDVARSKLNNESIQEALSEPWFIVLIVLICLMIIATLFYCVWFMVRRIRMTKKHQQHKYLSSSSENGSLGAGATHKINNGNSYKLVNNMNDPIWLDTLHSGSNHSSNEPCCCVPDLHHQIFATNNGNSNRHLIHDPSNEASIKSKFLSDTCTQHTNSNSSNSSSNPQQPQYAEIYGPALHQLQQIQMLGNNANPYATSGLFLNTDEQNMDMNHHSPNSANGGSNPYNIINYQTLNNRQTKQQMLNNQYSMKLLADKIQHDMNAMPMNANTMNEQKKLLKYLQQSTQSQSNTPRVLTKNIQNRLKSEANANQFCTMHHQPSGNSDFINQQRFAMPQLIQPVPHQMVTYLSDNMHQTTTDTITNDAIRNFLEQIPANPNQMALNALLQQQQQQQPPNSASTPIPSLPVVPPPSLASALLAQQQNHQQLTQQQQKQLIEGYNNLLNTISRSQVQAHSPVQYNSPWNEAQQQQQQQQQQLRHQSSFRLGTNQPSNNSSLISTISRAQQAQQQSTFTAQQYANRQNQQQMEEQQDYSSISPVDDIEEMGYKQQQQRNMNQQPQHGAHSWVSVGDSNSNPISSSYESSSGTNQNTHSLNTSDISSSKESQSAACQQHYANHDLDEEQQRGKSLFQPIAKRNDLNINESSEVYMPDMVNIFLNFFFIFIK